MTESKQKMEDWLKVEPTVAQIQRKSCFCSHYCRKTKFPTERFCLINVTILNSFEQCKIKTKISTLHDRRSMVISKHQIGYFGNQLQYGCHIKSIVCTNYSTKFDLVDGISNHASSSLPTSTGYLEDFDELPKAA